MKQNTKRMVFTAVMLSLATALSMVKIWTMPLGGSVTLLSMLPIAMLAIEYGPKWGFVSAFLYAIIQITLDLSVLMSWGLTPLIFVGALIFDYLLAYMVIGCAGLFRKKGAVGICGGIGLGLLLRFISHFISGSILFASWCPEGWNVVLYSVVYNGSYMIPEIVFTMGASVALFRTSQLRKIMAGDAL